MKYVLTSVAGLMFATTAVADTPVLTVYAPDYFGSEWGPGPAIEAAFEAECACDLEFVTGDVLPRLLLEGARTDADAVIGLNTDVTKKARESELFGPHGLDTTDLTMPIEWTDDTFVPFNWSYVAFIYDNTKIDTPPTSFDALLEMADVKLVIQDPRSSASGLALLLWVKAVYGKEAGAAWEKMAPQILTVTQGWSEAYGMFTDGEADMVLSYTTSPAYHLIVEDDATKSAAIFDEGHYFMAEVVGKIATTDQPELTDQFMAFILSDAFQSIIPEGNWSFPAKLDASRLPEKFGLLGMPETAIFYDENEADALREPALDEWLAALSR
ncbi:MAG: thiamine ABC transporter substrate binding subunit [Paracoccaceae bacterium]|jgi:thiamine transport system substrate-binding protein|nr:thiamine ABC transporter substrate binding subunit [Paracoccaceae bacterium]